VKGKRNCLENLGESLGRKNSRCSVTHSFHLKTRIHRKKKAEITDLGHFLFEIRIWGIEEKMGGSRGEGGHELF